MELCQRFDAHCSGHLHGECEVEEGGGIILAMEVRLGFGHGAVYWPMSVQVITNKNISFMFNILLTLINRSERTLSLLVFSFSCNFQCQSFLYGHSYKLCFVSVVSSFLLPLTSVGWRSDAHLMRS
jgi:hypothetical protein